jgi:putative transposase
MQYSPVHARLAAKAETWPWSSVGAHLRGEDDELVRVRPVLDRVERFADLIAGEAEEPAFGVLRAADFVSDLERRLGRPIARRAPGRKPAHNPTDQLASL